MRIIRNTALVVATMCLATALLVAPTAFAGSVDLTPSGANTTITISGTYASTVPTFGGIAAPSGTYTITFTLPTMTSSAPGFVSFPPPQGQSGFNADANLIFDLNGSAITTTFSSVTVEFFDTLSGDTGGILFCLDFPTCNTEWNLSGGALFDNNDANPTLLTGPISINQTLSGYFVGGAGPFPFGVAPTPEPSSLLLLGTGLAGLFGWGRRKFLA